jgi:hypothetical protein
MFEISDYSLYILDLEIDDYKRIILKDLYFKMINNDITYEEYYDGYENKYYWNLMKLYSFYILNRKRI